MIDKNKSPNDFDKNLKNHFSNKNNISEVNKEQVRSSDVNVIDQKKIHDKLYQELLTLQQELNTSKLLSNKKIDATHIILNKETEQAYKFCLEKIISSLLPIVDSLERALELSKSEVNDKNDSYSKNIKLILDMFSSIFTEFDVTLINKCNVLFDPNIHEAMSLFSSTTIPENYVISIMQNGYKLNERLLRPAMVIVSNGANNT
ncbi:MAG: nucleotide exchange factor GrpE [Buchnera aphidicola (Eriosoma harunire)]